MATKRLPVDIERVNWYDGQQVTEDELQDEQDRNVDIDAANVANFMGSGIIKKNSVPLVILDTENLNTQQQTMLDGYSFDGQNLYTGSPLNEVSDEVQGIHLAVTMRDVRLEGEASSRVTIIGDTFGDTLIHDDMIFEENITQITRGRYKNIRAIIFNDFAGNLRGSASYALEEDGYNLIGRCIIREAETLEISPDVVMVSQTKQPNRFFYNFYPASFTQTLNQLLEDAVGTDKSVLDLDIALDSNAQRELVPNNVTTRIGQKFKATGSNIQKISLLLSVKYDSTAIPADAYNWSGSITMNLHALQTEVDCPISPTPDNAIGFDPDPAVLAELSIDAEDLEKQGVVLDGYPQIVNFVFTGSKISDPITSPISVDRYYVFTINRSGDAHTGTLLIEEASDRTDNSYMVVFDGSQWVNIVDSDMWFNIEGDYIKVSDGISYEDGVGLQIPKIKKDETNTETAYVEGLLPLYTSTYDAYNYVLLEGGQEFSEPEQDQRTNNQVYSRVTPIPEISLTSQSSINTLIVSEPAPVLLGRIKDTNPRGNPSEITGTTAYIGLTTDDEINIISPDADIRTFNLNRSILVPNITHSAQYRIIGTTLYNDAYGDISGNGEITIDDHNTVSSWISRWGTHVSPTNRLSLSDAYVQQLIVDGYLNTLEFLRADVNGDTYVDNTDESLINDYVNKTITTFPAGSTFSRMNIRVESMLQPLTISADMWNTDLTLKSVPFSSIGWRIDYFATWFADLLEIEDLKRAMPTTFTEEYTEAKPGGQNNFYIPGDLILDGYILNPDETTYSIDFEVNHLSLEIPALDSYGSPTVLDGYSGILLFDNFVAESSNGKTSSGFNAMKYSDGTYVQMSDFSADKVKITAALQSIATEISAPFGSSIEDVIGLYYDPSTSLLTIKMENIHSDGYESTLPPTNTRILVTVYLKKAGFTNETSEISGAQMRQLLRI